MASNRNTIIRSLHDLGGAAWFGGSLMGAIEVNDASKDVKDQPNGLPSRLRDGRAGRLSPLPPSAHLIGAAGLLVANHGRGRDQRGAGANTAIKTVLTAAAIGSTVYCGVLGAKIATESGSAPAEGGTVPSEGHTRQCRQAAAANGASCSGLPPALTGGMLILGAQQGEHQRPSEQLRTRGWSAVKDAVNRVPMLAES
jgi:hypothetical protein